MTNVQLFGFRMFAESLFAEPAMTIKKTDRGFEVWRGDKLRHISTSSAGAEELIAIDHILG